MTGTDELAALLSEIRDQQREQIAMQTQALALQREHFSLAQAQIARAERVTDRAEALQVSAGKASRIALWVLVPALLIVLATIIWPYIRYYLYLINA